MTINCHRWPKWGPGGVKGAFLSTGKYFVGLYFGTIFAKSLCFCCGIFEGSTVDWYLVLLLVAHGSQNMCFLGWPTSAI